MAKQKVGLQKEISKIFTGIQIPKKDAAQPKPGSAAPVPAHYIPQKPSVPAPKPFTIPEPTQETPATPKQPAYSAPKPAVYEPQTPKQVPYQTPAPTAYESPNPEPTILPQVSAKDLKVKSGSKIPGLILWLKIQDFIKVKLLTPKPGVNPLKQKAMIVITPVLMLVFMVVMANMLLKSDPAKTKPAAAKASSAAAAAFDGKINWELPPPYPQNLRDPTTFGSLAPQNQAQQENADRPAVKGIVYSEDNPCAVVGDRIVSVGDVVDGATVVKINRDSVEFSAGDKNWSQKVER
jgi:hypothetical protein